MITGPRKEIQRIVDEYCRANPAGIRVLDAGCRCGSRIRFPETAKISGPNPLSLKWLISKCTPQVFHEWVYRNVYQYEHKPFRTHMKLCISPGRLLGFFEGHWVEYTDFEDHLFKRSCLNTIYRAVTSVIRVLALGRYDPRSNPVLPGGQEDLLTHRMVKT